MSDKVELKRLAEKGNIEAQFNLAEYYYEEEEKLEACKWYEKAALQGHTESQFCLGVSYYFGEEGLPVDIEKSRYWFRKAAEKGHTRAQRRLGDIFRFELNYVEAIKWYKKAIAKKDKLAMFYTALLNEPPNNFPGVDVNISVKLYEELSNDPFNDKGAMINLAYLYCMGDHVSRDALRGKALIEKCNLFKNSNVQLYDEIQIYDLYRIGVLYCSGQINPDNNSTADDLIKGIKLLDVAIADELPEFSPATLSHAKDCRDKAIEILNL